MTNLMQMQETREQLKKGLQEAYYSKGISQNKAAIKLGISAAYLSFIANDNWEAVPDEKFRMIWNKVMEGVSEIFDTSSFSVCTKACSSAKQNKFMVAIVADTGIGKTTALTAFARKKNVFYVVYDMTMRPKHFFIELLKEMGVNFEGSIHEMVKRIAEELNTIKDPLLIVDEAGKLTHTMITYLHVLRDKTINNCGIVLAGMPYFESNLRKFSNKQKVGSAEFLSRINLWQTLDVLSRKEIRDICEANGVVDSDFLREVQNKKRFRDLKNAITFYKLQQTD
jgi:transcriptional regulator with XRE-family HTH domain